MLKDFDVVFIGNFAIDKIFHNNGIKISLGGGTTYGSLAAYHFNKKLKIGICSNVGKSFNSDYFGLFSKTTIDLSGVQFISDTSTTYEITYSDNSRKLILKSRANPIEYINIPKTFLNAKYFILTPIANEISINLIETLKKRTKAMFALDVQGIIRKFNIDGSIDYTPDKKNDNTIKKLIKICGDCLILKASEDEANYIAGEKDVLKSTIKMADIENSIILSTLGENGSLIKWKKEKLVHIPAFQPEILADETGAGDAFLGVFVSDLINRDISIINLKNAGYCASAAASFLVEQNGPNGFRAKKEILKRIKSSRIIKSPFHTEI